MAELREYGHIINPTFARHTLNKGEVTTGSFTYTNGFTEDNNSKKSFTTLIAFIYQENGTPKLYQKTPANLQRYDMSSWVKVNETQFTLKPSEQKKITYTIETPINAQPGGKYAVIIVIPTDEADRLEGSGAEINAYIGYPLISKIAGTENLESDILSFTTDKKLYFRWPMKPIVFTTTAKNSGNVDYLLGGDIFVHKGDITNPIWQTTINESDLVIFPENTRSFSNEWQNTEPLVSIQDGSVTFNTDYFKLGKYTATAKIGYDSGGQRLVSDKVVEFWILPIPLIIAILLTIIGLYLGIRKWLKKK